MTQEPYYTAVKDPLIPCRVCQKPGSIVYRVVESSCGGFEDTKYKCNACGSIWWIDGPDA